MEERVTALEKASEVLLGSGSDFDRHLVEIGWAHLTLEGYDGEQANAPDEVLKRAQRYLKSRGGADLAVSVRLLEREL